MPSESSDNEAPSTPSFSPPGWLTVLIFVGLASLGIVLAPPLFQFDGYTYRLYGLTPVGSLNPAHLLWVPMQAVFWWVFGWLHLSGTVPFQVVGIFLTALACTLLFRLLAARREDLALAVVSAVFVMTSPWVWYLAPINQPYPSLFLVTLALVAAWRKTPRGWLEYCWLGFAVYLAAMLHEAAVLWAGVVAGLLFFLTPGLARQRIERCFCWGLDVALAILASYLLAGWLLNLSSFKDLMKWAAGYLDQQHGLSHDLVGSLIQGGFGIFHTFIQGDWLRNWLLDRYEPDQLKLHLAIAEGILVAGGLALLFWRRFRQWIRGWPWRNPLFLASLCLMTAWGIFCLLWEPTNYYWAVNLFPFFVVVGLILQKSPTLLRWLWMAGLCLGMIWNMHENHRADLQNAGRFPDPQLAQIHQVVRPQDRLIFFQRDGVDQVDYDLLAECLERSGQTPPTTLVEKCFSVKPADWEASLQQEIDGVLKAGGRVFVSNLVFAPASYENLGDNGPLYAPANPAYKAIDGTALQQRVEQFFAAYDRRPAELQFGSDHFWVIVGKRLAGAKPGIRVVR